MITGDRVHTSPRRLLSAVITVPLLGAVVAACGTTTVDPKSGEDLFRSYVAERVPTDTVVSVSCPSGIKPKDGTSFVCKFVVRDNGTRVQRKGTVTVHVTGGGKKVEMSPADIKLQ